MNLKDWNLAQVKEALTTTNRFYFWQRYGREAKDDNELLLYYAEFGEEIFAEKHKGERYDDKTPSET